VNVEELKDRLAETEISKTESAVIISKIQELSDSKLKDKNYMKKQTEKIFHLMNSQKLNNEDDEINYNSIQNSPKFAEKPFVRMNSIDTTEKNLSLGNFQITAISDLDSAENVAYRESLSSLRENIKTSAFKSSGEETVRIIIINSYKKFFA
jgi:hypothetical protein